MKVVKRWFFVWQEDQERVFLEDMALMGYVLKKVGLGKYEFEEDVPCERIYQFDFRGLSRIPEEEYLQLYADAGWECLARFGGWYYFSKLKTEGEEIEELFGDNQSRRQKVHRVLFFLLLTGFPLYYQTLIVFPGINLVDSTLPRFYSFFHGVMIVLMLLHMSAIVLIGRMAWRLKRRISE